MPEPVHIGIDQGTRSSKSVVRNASGEELFVARCPVTLTEKEESVVEQDPRELLESVKTVLDQALTFAKKQAMGVRGIGLAVQRSGVCAWDAATGAPLHPLISWADTRTAGALNKLGEKKALVTQKTSLPVTPHYAAGKISLLQKEFPQKNSLVGTLDSFLLWHLIQERPFETEDTMAARTMLYRIDTHAWDGELADLFLVDATRLPTIVPSVYARGAYGEVPITACLGDQQAALLSFMGSGLDLIINLGSIISLLIPTGEPVVSVPGYMSSVFCSRTAPSIRSYQHLLEGTVNAAARVVDHLIEKKYLNSVTEVDELCRQSCGRGTQNAVFLPFGGTASPDWLTPPSGESGYDGQTKSDYVRAAIENIGSFVVRQIRHLQSLSVLPQKPRVFVSGGLSMSRYLLQFIADCCRLDLKIVSSTEATAHGAALAAAYIDTPSQVQRVNTSSVVDVVTGVENREADAAYERWRALLTHATR